MKYLIVANWKMNPASYKEATNLWKAYAKVDTKNTEVVVCSPFPFLSIKKEMKSKKVMLGAQDVAGEASGPYTGEVSASMLKDMGVKYVIIGHSDTRAKGDTNQSVNKKILSALKLGLKPIVCIGERERDDHGFYLHFIKTEIQECFANVSRAQLANISIAYEPIWSISTTPGARAETPEDSLEMSLFILKTLSDIFSTSAAKDVRIIYGGSVDDVTIGDFLAHGGASGVLVGRASLDPKKFANMIHICETLKK